MGFGEGKEEQEEGSRNSEEIWGLHSSGRMVAADRTEGFTAVMGGRKGLEEGERHEARKEGREQALAKSPQRGLGMCVCVTQQQ